MTISPVVQNCFVSLRYDFPPDLKEMARRSCITPQWGPHHTEGLYMGEGGSHLERVAIAVEGVFGGEFHPDVPTDTGIREAMAQAARDHKRLIPEYILLHDVAKRFCMTVFYEDGRAKPIEWPDFFEGLPHPDRAGVTAWDVMQESGIKDMMRILRHHGISKISYYQDTPGARKSHAIAK